MTISAISKFAVFRALLVGLLVGGLAAGCAEVRFLSEYDAFTDRQVSMLQTDVERTFTAMERRPTRPACAHANFEDFYADSTVAVNVLIARNEVRDKNEPTIRMLKLLKASISDLEELHKLKDAEGTCVMPEELQPLRSAFGTQFGGILKLELAKQRGLEQAGTN